MRLLKESFDALIQYRTEKPTDNYSTVGDTLKEGLQTLRKEPSHEKLEVLLSIKEFQKLCSDITSVKGGQDGMTVAYLRDVSAVLALVAAVREKDIALHLEAERDMLKHIFAFDHQNYSRYLSYQHVLLNHHQLHNSNAFQDLKERGIGANYSGSKFAAVHGDLVTEYFNRETKGTAGPFRQGYSTNIASTNKWVNTIHIHAKLRMAMRDKVNIKTPSTHKELTDGPKKRHYKDVLSLKETLKSYKANLFDNGPAKFITTGVEANSKTIQGLLQAPEKGNKEFLKFVEDRLIKKTKSIYSPISKQKIDTGMKKNTKSPRAISVLKEDV